MKKSTRNADARSKSTTKRPFKSAYAVEKHDENEKVAPPPPVRTVLLRTKKKKKKKKEKRFQGFQDEAKTKRQRSALRKQRMTRRGRERKRINGGH